MNASTVGRLLQDCPNIAGLKEASGNMSQATDVLKVKRPGFTVLSGDDAIILPLMAMGFDGVISVMANVLPRVCSGLVNLMSGRNMRMPADGIWRYRICVKLCFRKAIRPV